MHYILFCVVATLSILLTSVMGMQDWDFVLHKFDYNTSNPDLLTINIKSTRKEPGVYALNGTALLGIDVDDKFSVEVKIYRSPSGSGPYKITPYQVQKQVFSEFIQNFYVPMLQKDFESCASLPTFDDKFDKPIEKGKFSFNMCLITNGGMPSHIQPGFYKIIAQLKSDELEFWITLTAEAEPKSLV